MKVSKIELQDDFRHISDNLNPGNTWNSSGVLDKEDEDNFSFQKDKTEIRAGKPKELTNIITEIVNYAYKIVNSNFNSPPLFKNDISNKITFGQDFNRISANNEYSIKKGNIYPAKSALAGRYYKSILKKFLIADIYNNIDNILLSKISTDLHPFFFSTGDSFSSNNEPEKFKLTIAFANSLYYEISAKAGIINNLVSSLINPGFRKDFSNPLSEAQFLLVKCELTGIKEYIISNNFDQETESIRNISNYFKLLLFIIKDYCLSNFSLTSANLLFESNKSFSLLLPYSFLEILNQCQIHVNSVLSTAFDGSIYFLTASEKFNINEVGQVHCKWNNILEYQGNKIYNLFDDINYKIFKPFNYHSDRFFSFSSDLFQAYNFYKLKTKCTNVSPKIKKEYRNCFSVFNSFGYKLDRRNNTKNKYIDQISHSKQTIPSGNAIMEIVISPPDSFFNTIEQELDLLSIVEYYKRYESISNKLFSDFNNHSDNNIIQILYQSDGNYILTGKLKDLIHIPINIKGKISDNNGLFNEIPVYMNILYPGNRLTIENSLRILQRHFNGNKLKGKFSNKLILFNIEFSQKEFCKFVELIELFLNLLSGEDLTLTSKNVLIRCIYKSSLLFNKLMDNSVNGYLYFDEIINFRYKLSGVEGINEENKFRLMEIYENILTRNLVGNGKISNKMILPAVCKALDIILNNKGTLH